MDVDKIYSKLNSLWKKTCNIVLKGEVGDLKEFEPYLKEVMYPTKTYPSCINNEPVHVLSTFMPKQGRYITYDQISQYSAPSLSINEIKDIDSIVEAIKDNWVYIGNTILGNSEDVVDSTAVYNSKQIYCCNDVGDCQHMAFVSRAKLCSYCFGGDWGGNCQFLIHSTELSFNNRGFEAHACWESNDVYFSFLTKASSEIIFCFGGSGKRFAIGNLQLSKDKYLKIKEKLLEDIRTELQRKKRCISLFDIVNAIKPDIPEKTREEVLEACSEKEKSNPDGYAKIEKAFQQTSRVLMAREVGTLDEMKNYLLKGIAPFEKKKSILSGVEKLVSPQAIPYYQFSHMGAVTACELEELSKKLHIDEDALPDLSLENVEQKLKTVAVVAMDCGILKNSTNIIDCSVVFNCSNLYYCVGVARAKFAAYSFWPRISSYCWGVNTVLNSQFLINAYYSENITRGFEIDSCNNCSDIYFCHACDGCRDCMFTVAQRGKTFTIGNTSLPKEKYNEVKNALVQQIADELSTNKDLHLSIYDIHP